MKYREHHGGLAESMRTVVELADRAALVSLIQKRLAHYEVDIKDEQIHVIPYARDERIGWLDTHLVTLDSYGVLGYTDGPPHSAHDEPPA